MKAGDYIRDLRKRLGAEKDRADRYQMCLRELKAWYPKDPYFQRRIDQCLGEEASDDTPAK